MDAVSAASTQVPSQGSQGVQAAGGHHRHHGEATLDAAAEALGMDVKDVVSALRSGKSLDDLATQQGVSHDDLVSAVRSALPQRAQQSGRADDIAESIVSRKGLPQRPEGARQAGGDGAGASTASGVLGSALTPAQDSMLTGLGSVLGMDPQDVLTSLRSGTSLTDLLDSKGVSRDQLAGVLQDGLLVDAKA